MVTLFGDQTKLSKARCTAPTFKTKLNSLGHLPHNTMANVIVVILHLCHASRIVGLHWIQKIQSSRETKEEMQGIFTTRISLGAIVRTLTTLSELHNIYNGKINYSSRRNPLCK